MGVSIIAAMDRNQLIGQGKALPWRLPADLKHFKRLTMAKPIVMGRRTWQSLGGPLPGRQNIVLTRSANYKAEGATVVSSLDQALEVCSGAAEVMIIGGAQVYQAALSCADRFYLTRVEGDFKGDVWFPAIDWQGWQQLSKESHSPDEHNFTSYSFEVYQRRD